MKIPIEVEDMGRHHIGDVVLSDVEIADAQRSGGNRELRMKVHARVLRLIEAKKDEHRLPGALAFRRALQGCE